MPRVRDSSKTKVILSSLKIVLLAPNPQPGRSGSKLNLFAQVRICDRIRKLQGSGFQFDSDSKKLNGIEHVSSPFWDSVSPSVKILEKKMDEEKEGTLEILESYPQGSNFIFLAVSWGKLLNLFEFSHLQKRDHNTYLMGFAEQLHDIMCTKHIAQCLAHKNNYF